MMERSSDGSYLLRTRISMHRTVVRILMSTAYLRTGVTKASSHLSLVVQRAQVLAPVVEQAAMDGYSQAVKMQQFASGSEAESIPWLPSKVTQIAYGLSAFSLPQSALSLDRRVVTSVDLTGYCWFLAPRTAPSKSGPSALRLKTLLHPPVVDEAWEGQGDTA